MKLIFDIKIWIGILFVALIIGLRFSGVGEYITLSSFQEQRDHIMALVDAHYAWSALIYIAFYITVVVLALPLAALSTVAGGFLFGVFAGTIYANIGATIGATIFFLLVRYSFGSILQEKYKDKLEWFNKEMEKYGVMYLIAIHFVAVIPFFIMNLLIGLTKTSLWTFIWTTSISIIPGTLVYAFAGQQLTKIHAIQDIFSGPVLIAFGLLLLLALVPVVAKKFGWFGMQ